MRLHTRAAITLAAVAVLPAGLALPASAAPAPAPVAPVVVAPADSTTPPTTPVPTTPRPDKASRAKARAAAMRASAVRIARYKAPRASYVGGMAGPNSFDCSGFTSWVWKQAGKSIPRTSYDQYASLKRISRSSARPGDLVFFFKGGVHHVEIYLGNNKIVGCANSRTDCQVKSLSSWYADHLSGFRRVV